MLRSRFVETRPWRRDQGLTCAFELKTCFIKIMQTASKSRITDVQATVAQKPDIAASRNRSVFDFGALFLFLFLSTCPD